MVVNAEPCARRILGADIRAAESPVEADARHEVIEAAPCQAAAVPEARAVAELFKLQRQGRFHRTVPKRLVLVELHIRIKDAREQAHKGRLRDHAAGQEVRERYRMRLGTPFLARLHEMELVVQRIKEDNGHPLLENPVNNIQIHYMA